MADIQGYVCKCCLSAGDHKDLWAEYMYDGEVKVYGDMLKECFQFDWAEPDNILEKICNNCVKRLRLSLEFRHEILAAQEELSRVIQETHVETKVCKEDFEINEAEFLIKKEELIIEEYVEDEQEAAESDFGAETFEDQSEEGLEYLDLEQTDDTDMEVEYLESDAEAETAIKRHRTRNQNPKVQKYKQYTQLQMERAIKAVRTKRMTIPEAAQSFLVPVKTLRIKVKTKHVVKEVPDGENDDRKIKMATNKKHYENIKTILKYSNATPIKGHWGLGFACCFCETQFADANDLKSHTLDTHYHSIEEFMKHKSSKDFVVKLDVTDLECSICDLKLEKLEDLTQHLAEHSQIIHNDIPNQILPFKFDSDVLKCAVCSKQFDYFKVLNDHMNEHYSNFECDVCLRTFINMTSLRMHSYRHIGGKFPCTICPKVFLTNQRKYQHERKVHLQNSKAFRCSYCDERFSDSVAKNKHENIHHGAELRTYECQACDAKFHRISSLKHHTKSYHLLDKPHMCRVCEGAFSTKRDLERHAKTHEEVKNYQCALCSKSFVRKHYLLKHTRNMHENYVL